MDDPLHPDKFNPDRFQTPEGGPQGSQLVFGAGGIVLIVI